MSALIRLLKSSASCRCCATAVSAATPRAVAAASIMRSALTWAFSAPTVTCLTV